MRGIAKCSKEPRLLGSLRIDPFQDAGSLDGDDHSNKRDGNGVDKKGDNSGAFGKVGFDEDLNVFLDSFIPG